MSNGLRCQSSLAVCTLPAAYMHLPEWVLRRRLMCKILPLTHLPNHPKMTFCCSRHYSPRSLASVGEVLIARRTVHGFCGCHQLGKAITVEEVAARRDHGNFTCAKIIAAGTTAGSTIVARTHLAS